MATKKSTMTPKAVRKARATTTITKPIATADGESKKDAVLRLLRRQHGTSIAEIATETSWQPHSVRGFLTATVKKKLELPLVSTKEPGKDRRYHIGALKPAKA